MITEQIEGNLNSRTKIIIGINALERSIKNEKF
jgi:hypothetical protein